MAEGRFGPALGLVILSNGHFVFAVLEVHPR